MRCEFEGKVIFQYKEDAEKRAEEINSKSGTKLRAYRCPYYQHWHLTSMSDDLHKKVHKRFLDKQKKRIELESEFWENKLKDD